MVLFGSASVLTEHTPIDPIIPYQISEIQHQPVTCLHSIDLNYSYRIPTIPIFWRNKCIKLTRLDFSRVVYRINYTY